MNFKLVAVFALVALSGVASGKMMQRGLEQAPLQYQQVESVKGGYQAPLQTAQPGWTSSKGGDFQQAPIRYQAPVKGGLQHETVQTIDQGQLSSKGGEFQQPMRYMTKSVGQVESRPIQTVQTIEQQAPLQASSYKGGDFQQAPLRYSSFKGGLQHETAQVESRPIQSAQVQSIEQAPLQASKGGDFQQAPLRYQAPVKGGLQHETLQVESRPIQSAQAPFQNYIKSSLPSKGY